jgi:O-acetyl-ADP-ribose deacetylase (regulator of RNase III)
MISIRENRRNVEFIAKRGTFELRGGDLSAVDVDVIVCPSNQGLEAKFGVSGVLLRKGGPSIQKEARALAAEYAKLHHGTIEMPYGSAHFTGAGKLNANFVSHVLNTKINERDQMFSTRKMIIDSLTNTLIESDKREQRSIALPLLGTGFGGVSIWLSSTAIANTSIEYLNGTAKTVERIILVTLPDLFENVRKAVEKELSK